MRILYCGNFKRTWDTESYVARAMKREGHTVRLVEFRGGSKNPNQVIKIAREFEPEMTLFSNPSNLEAFDRERFGIRAIWNFDLLHSSYSMRRWQWINRISRQVDLVFLTDGMSAAEIENAHVVRQGVPDDAFAREPNPSNTWNCDVAFIGSLYGDRIKWWESVKMCCKSLGLRCQNLNDVRGTELLDLCASVPIIIGPKFPSREGYWSNRLYVVTGYGGCFLTPAIKGMYSEEGWAPGIHYARYRANDLSDLSSRISFLMDLEGGRTTLARRGREHARKHFTYDHRVEELVGHIEDWRNENQP